MTFIPDEWMQLASIIAILTGLAINYHINIKGKDKDEDKDS